MIDLIAGISQANEYEIEALLKAVLRRYAVLFPAWEVSAISVHKKSDQNAQIDEIIHMLQRMKRSPG